MQLREALAEWVSQAVGAEVIITRMIPLAGGASRQSWSVDLTIRDGAEAGAYQLVLRRDLRSEMQPNALTRRQEFELLQLAHRAGVRVPRPRWFGQLVDQDQNQRPFLLMDRIEGESIGARVVRLPELATARSRLSAQMGEQLARIHALAPEPPWLPRPPDKTVPADWMLRRLRHLAEEIQIVNPAYELALRWLEANQPKAYRTVLVHGDFRIGNMIINDQGLLGVIDWEFSHVGDPAEDLAWPGLRDWRFGQDALGFGGVGQRADFYAAYQAAGGGPVDLEAVGYWEILGNLRWAIGCLSQARRHLSGDDLSIELASLGRRAAEMELEFLRLIEQAESRISRGGS